MYLTYLIITIYFCNFVTKENCQPTAKIIKSRGKKNNKRAGKNLHKTFIVFTYTSTFFVTIIYYYLIIIAFSMPKIGKSWQIWKFSGNFVLKQTHFFALQVKANKKFVSPFIDRRNINIYGVTARFFKINWSLNIYSVM